MAQQQMIPVGDTARPRAPRLLRPTGLLAAAAGACLVVGLGLGFALGHQRPAMHDATVRCVSSVTSIQCDTSGHLGDGKLSVPLDVAWTDAEGTLHEGGRPACLAPSGNRVVGPVEVTWTKVEALGRSLEQVVGVQC